MGAIKRVLSGLSWGAIALLIILALWFGGDLWNTFSSAWRDRHDDKVTFNVRPARALAKAKLARVKGPDTIVVHVLSEKDGVAIRERHGVVSRSQPVPAVAGVVASTPDSPTVTDQLPAPAFLLDMRDVFIEHCEGGTQALEVACWLFADGHGQITVVERPKTAVEKVAGVAGDVGHALKATFWQRSAVEIGASADPFDTTHWRGWAVWEAPLKLAHVRLRAGGEFTPVLQEDGSEKVEAHPIIAAAWRFELGRK